MEIDCITVDCADPLAVATFWNAALGWGGVAALPDGYGAICGPRDGGTYLEMGQFTDAGAIETNWHRICTKDINVLGSWAFTANDIPQGIAMLDRARARYPWYDMQTLFPFTEAGVAEAIAAAMAMRTVKSTIVPSGLDRSSSPPRQSTVPMSVPSHRPSAGTPAATSSARMKLLVCAAIRVVSITPRARNDHTQKVSANSGPAPSIVSPVGTMSITATRSTAEGWSIAMR